MPKACDAIDAEWEKLTDRKTWDLSKVQERSDAETCAKKNKKRQEILELIHVFIAFIIIIGMAVGIVVLDNVLFPEERNITFVPLQQNVHSTIMYTGNGFIPCNG